MEAYLIQTTVYVLLITLFHRYTNGFVQKGIWTYCTLKTLPVLLLSVFSYYGLSGFTTERRLIFAAGQLFGASGDFLLSTSRNGFLLGSLSFAIGHLAYIAYFVEHLENLSLIVLITFTLYTLLTDYYVIVPYFYRFKVLFWILIVYSIVICTGMVVAGSLYINGAANGASGDDYMSLALGYLLFVISDTCIVLQIIGYKSEYMHEFILFTYYASQYLIYRSALCSQYNVIV